MAVDRFSAPETLVQFSGAWKAAESEEETAVETPHIPQGASSSKAL